MSKRSQIRKSIIAVLLVTCALISFTSLPSHEPVKATTSAIAQTENPKALLGLPVRHVFKGHMVTTILSSYDASSDSYNGHVLFPESVTARKLIQIGKGNTLDAEEQIALVLPVKGLRRYPYAERPTYKFQFVFTGEDEQPLLNIAAAD